MSSALGVILFASGKTLFFGGEIEINSIKETEFEQKFLAQKITKSAANKLAFIQFLKLNYEHNVIIINIMFEIMNIMFGNLIPWDVK